MSWRRVFGWNMWINICIISHWKYIFCVCRCKKPEKRHLHRTRTEARRYKCNSQRLSPSLMLCIFVKKFGVRRWSGWGMRIDSFRCYFHDQTRIKRANKWGRTTSGNISIFSAFGRICYRRCVILTNDVIERNADDILAELKSQLVG